MLAAYCTSLRLSHGADLALFDDAMRPILTRVIRARAGGAVRDATVGAAASALARTVAASTAALEISRVPAPIRGDVRAVRIEKQAILEHAVAAANGDAAGFDFLVQAESNGGGVVAALSRIGVFTRASCGADAVR